MPAPRFRPSTQSTRAQSSRASKVTRIDGMSTISAKTAYMPIPASTVASSAILISATRMPSIITSSIDHISKWWAQRSISPTQCGGGVRRAAISRISMNERYAPGAITAQKAMRTLTIGSPSSHIW